MKSLIIILILPLISLAEVSYETTFRNGIWKTSKKELSGIGFNLISQVKIEDIKNETTGLEEKKITTSFQNCKNIEIPLSEQAKSLKNGDYIKFKLNDPSSCNIGGWQKLK